MPIVTEENGKMVVITVYVFYFYGGWEMKISYDAAVDAVYMRFCDKLEQVVTHRLTEDIAINYGARGDVVGIEILSAHEHLKFSGRKPTLQAENLKIAS